MPYTLSKGLLWFLIALLIGLIVGWLLRSVHATRQLRAARHGRTEPAELEHLRGRLAELEPVVAERDRLHAELAALRAAPAGVAAGSAEPVGVPDEADLDVATDVDAVPGPSDAVDESGVDGAELVLPETETQPAAVVDDAPTQAAPSDADEHLPELDADGSVSAPSTQSLAAELDPLPEETSPTGTDAGEAPLPETLAPEPADDVTNAAQTHGARDLGRAAAVPGKKIKLDDLTAIEGIGPAIAGLCHGIGIHTWADMAETEVSLLRTMLADAGPRYSVHHPDTWPQQAALLAAGRWQELADLVSRLSGGKLDG